MFVTLPDFGEAPQDGSSQQSTVSRTTQTETCVRDQDTQLSQGTASLTDNCDTGDVCDSIQGSPLCKDLDGGPGRRRSRRLPTHGPLVQSEAAGGGTAHSGVDNELPDVDWSLLNIPSKYEELCQKVWAAGWNVSHIQTLPEWLRSNDCLIRGHRVPNNSFNTCFKSIFRIHSETGNIWTHLLGMVAFISIAIYFLSRSSSEIQLQEKVVFSPFFLGAILCLGFSWVFHAVSCHSQSVGLLFNKLDYVGIVFMTQGSFVPWMYYTFYCRFEPKIIYSALILILGTIVIIVSMWNTFASPKYRPLRAGLFVAFGISGGVPAVHYCITDGVWHAFNEAAFGWLVLMAFLYIAGAFIYAARIPERIFPGTFDIWFQSHQIMHVCVLAAAFVHYHGISEIANYRLSLGGCGAPELQ